MTPTDDRIMTLLSGAPSGDDRAFRLRVIEGIVTLRQREAALRRLVVQASVFGLVGITFALLQQSEAGIAITEPLATAVCLCGAAAELAGWLINGRSLLGSAYK